MENTNHEFYSLYKRKDSPNFYVQFWDDKSKTYLPGRSTRVTTKREARLVCQKWLAEYGGRPPKNTSKKGIQKKDVLIYLTRFLVDSDIIEEGTELSSDEILSKTEIAITGMDSKLNNPCFIDYLLDFWDWEHSSYIKDKLESGQSIGKTYCHGNKRFIEIWAEPFFKDMKIRSVSTFMLEQFKSQLPRKSPENNKGLTPRSINAILGCISVPLGEAKRLGIISENPSTNMRKLSTKDSSRGVLTPDEVKSVLSVEWKDERSKIASQLAACHGLRAGEIGALKIQDIDSSKNIIYIRGSWERQQRKIKTPKNGHSRIIYTDKHIIDNLLHLYSENPHNNDFIFWNLTKTDEPINLDNFRDYLQDALVESGMPLEEQKERKISFHSWRHFSNSVLRGDISDPVLRQAMGHLSEEMTDRYYHMTSEQGEQYRNSVARKIIPLVFDSNKSIA